MSTDAGLSTQTDRARELSAKILKMLWHPEDLDEAAHLLAAMAERLDSQEVK